jgi:hypothetical protein
MLNSQRGLELTSLARVDGKFLKTYGEVEMTLQNFVVVERLTRKICFWGWMFWLEIEPN